MTPRIVYSPIGDRWFVTTRYVEKTAANGAKHLVAIRKHDVTDQMNAILKKHGRLAVKEYVSGRLTRVW